MRRMLFNPPGLADTLRAASVVLCWPRCFDASVEAYASRDPTGG